MKNAILSVSLLAAMSIVAAASATSGPLSINGMITAATCTVTGAGGATGTGHITVKLDTYSVDDFADNEVIGEKSVSFQLGGGEDCADGKVYSMRFQGGGPNADANGNLNNAARVDAATGVQIRIVGTNGYPIDFTNDQNAPDSTTSSDNQAEIKGLRVGYIRKSATPTSGFVSTSVEYVLTHN